MSRRVADRSRPRRFRALLICAAVACLMPSALIAAPTAASAAHKRHKQTHRVGGKVHRAWPYHGKAPRSALARWLARQVGPTKVKPCERRVKRKVVHCRRPKPPRRGAPPAPSRKIYIKAVAFIAIKRS